MEFLEHESDCTLNGIVKLRRQLAEWADDQPRRQLPPAPIPGGDHQSRRLALPPFLFELPRYRRSPRPAGHHGFLRDDSAVVSAVRSGVRPDPPAPAGTP